jgi:1-acyl-sn-glycerol-3-phosphate acyltransferase
MPSALRSTAAALLIAVSMICIALFGIVVQAPLLILWPAGFRLMTSRLVGSWEIWCGWILEVVYGIKPNVTGDKIDAEVGSVIISNHRTRLDWAMIWSVLARTRGTYALKVILGWACEMSRYIFLQRKFELDEAHLKGMLSLVSTDPHYSLLIFPEGTDLNPEGIARSKKWAEERGLPHYSQILHPRTKGFVEMVNALKRGKYPIQKVFDVTMGYRGSIAQNEAALVKGKTPYQMDVHTTAFDVNKDLPQDEEGLDAWVRARFRMKEDALKEYYSNTQLGLEECLLRAAEKLRKENPFNGASSVNSPVNTPYVTSGGASATPEANGKGAGANGAFSLAAAPSSSSSAITHPVPILRPELAYRCTKNSNPTWANFPTANYFAAAVKVLVFVLFGISLFAAYPLLTVGWFAFVTGFFTFTRKYLGGLDSFEVRQFTASAAGSRQFGNMGKDAGKVEAKKTW